MTSKKQLKYLTASKRDEEWGIVVTTIGSQIIDPHSNYPPSTHPNNYKFNPNEGRVLNEYQLVYITQGEGVFTSKSCKIQKISTGTILLLFPGEWHNYHPNNDTGWHEYWVGFKGLHIDKRVENGFFSKESPINDIGVSVSIIGLYEQILHIAEQEKAGFQQMVSSMVLNILGTVYYKQKNNSFTNRHIINKINEAQLIMKQEVESHPSTEELADRIGLGYSWFRRMFKEYTGVSPAQYQIQQKLLRAKELLLTTDMNISEIAYKLNFENISHFTTFFKKKEGVTPSDFKKRIY